MGALSAKDAALIKELRDFNHDRGARRIEALLAQQEALRWKIAAVLCNSTNYPEGVGKHILGRDMTALIDKVFAAVTKEEK